MLNLRLLGPVELRLDDKPPPADLLWRKHLALLIYLVRSPRGRARDHLVGMFWPEKDDQKARHSLSEALRVLRRVLGDDVVTEADVVRLKSGAVRTDLDTPGAYGVFLEGFSLPDAPAFEDWVARERIVLRGAALEALVAGGERAIAEGSLREAREAAHRALALDDRHEPSVRLFMRAAVLAGDRVAALEAYDTLERRLKDDLGTGPEPETRTLAARIRSATLPGPPAREGRPPGEPVPLVGVGRRLLARLTELWRGVRSGCRVALIRGDPGTGKTRLADELAQRAQLDGAAVCLARAVDHDAAADLWRTWLGGLLQAELGGASPEALAGLASLDPEVAVRYPGARQARALPAPDAMAAGIAAVADARPVLLVLDDAHLAHPDAVRFIGQVAQQARHLPVAVLVATTRPGGGALDDLTARIGRDVQGLALETGALEEPDVGELVAWALPAYSPDSAERLVRRVMADTAGNPLLAVEVIRAVRDGLAMAKREAAAWPARERTLDDTLPGDLSPMVVAALRQRFRALSEPAQRALVAVAVLGGRTDPDALARGARLDRAALERALDELEWERWLSADARGYTFVTRLVREVILAEMVTRGEQRRVRERAANG